MQQKKTTQEEYQKCVNAVVDYINLHLGEEIDLKSLARISHFSPFYFHRIMKAFLGEPVGTFIVRTRTEAAARLLRYSDMPIADIAYRIGYSSPSSLSKVFKQFYGISPLEYRNNKNFVIMKPAIIRPELGVIGRLGKFALSVGFHTVNFKHHEVTVGVVFIILKY